MEYIISLEFFDVFPYLALLVFVVVVVNCSYLISLRNFFKALKDAEPETYRDLSTVKPIAAMSIRDVFQDSSTSFRYFKNKEYEDLEDENVRNLGSRVRWLFFAGLIFTAIGLVIFFGYFIVVPILYSLSV